MAAEIEKFRRKVARMLGKELDHARAKWNQAEAKSPSRQYHRGRMAGLAIAVAALRAAAERWVK